ncbi:MAG TPA: mechanosensitive ion channel family protein [Candidatus Eisenbacteria bacterium]|nr:mechanosensitive ion channel family protein [Candidatus Eisenbacteria bacterium]
MPDASTEPWLTIAPILTEQGPRVLLVRLSQLFVHGVVKTLMDREATEGTAQELSAVEVAKRIDTLDQLAGNVLRFFIVIIAGLMILRGFDLDIGPAIAGLGIVGIAVGFGAQQFVRDYLNGALILVENQFSKGDVVRIAGVSGTVEDFSLRRTTLRDLDGVVHSVPNGEIKVASNLTRVWAGINQDVTLAHGTDVDRAIEVVDRVGREMAEDPAWKRRILETPKVARVSAIGEAGVTLKILGTVRAPDQWEAAGELRRRLLAAFREHGIELPRPQRVVLVRESAGAPAGTAAGPPTDGPTDDELTVGSE